MPEGQECLGPKLTERGQEQRFAVSVSLGRGLGWMRRVKHAGTARDDGTGDFREGPGGQLHAGRRHLRFFGSRGEAEEFAPFLRDLTAAVGSIIFRADLRAKCQPWAGSRVATPAAAATTLYRRSSAAALLMLCHPLLRKAVCALQANITLTRPLHVQIAALHGWNPASAGLH